MTFNTYDPHRPPAVGKANVPWDGLYFDGPFGDTRTAENLLCLGFFAGVVAAAVVVVVVLARRVWRAKRCD